MKPEFFDIHTHFPKHNPEICAIQSVRFGESAPGNGRLISCGLHPWYLDSGTLPQATRWLQEMAESAHVAAIGEAGLDKICPTPWPLQMEAFLVCIEWAEQSRKPLIIHCVRAYQELIALKKRLNPAQPWILHGFNRHADIARQCLSVGFFLSFGAAIMKPESPVLESFRICPDERFFLETDNQEGISIQRIYQRAAELKGDTLFALQQKMRDKLVLFPAIK